METALLFQRIPLDGIWPRVPEYFLADSRAIADAPGQACDGLTLNMVMSEAKRMFPPASPTSLYGVTPGSVPPESLAAAARSILADRLRAAGARTGLHTSEMVALRRALAALRRAARSVIERSS